MTGIYGFQLEKHALKEKRTGCSDTDTAEVVGCSASMLEALGSVLQFHTVQLWWQIPPISTLRR